MAKTQVRPPHQEQQRHINYNRSPKGKSDFLKAAKDAAESHSDEELLSVVSDVNEYGIEYRNVCIAEIERRKAIK